MELKSLKFNISNFYQYFYCSYDWDFVMKQKIRPPLDTWQSILFAFGTFLLCPLCSSSINIFLFFFWNEGKEILNSQIRNLLVISFFFILPQNGFNFKFYELHILVCINLHSICIFFLLFRTSFRSHLKLIIYLDYFDTN